MRASLLISFLILTTIYSCAPKNGKNSLSLKDSDEYCECVDGSFSSTKELPFAYSTIGAHEVAFCGYTGGVYEMDSLIFQSDHSGFKRTGFEIILCSNDSSLFTVGEYYTDSIHILNEGFKLYQLSNFPSNNNLKYQRIPLLEFHFTVTENKITIDTTLAIPNSFLSSEYLSELEDLVEHYKSDTSDVTKYLDLNLHYLFLRALSNEKFKQDFILSGPYDGYMGPIFKNFKSYLHLEIGKNGG